MLKHRRWLVVVALLISARLTGLAQTPTEPPRKATRPPVEKRRFTSTAVENEIARVTRAVADPDLAWMFQACYPNTLDTTVTFTTESGKPDTFVITGDINAMWLRDSSAQVQAYLPLCKQDAHLAEMIIGLINRQTACILIDPYANAFLKDASKPSPHARDRTLMQPSVYQRDWELDSLCYCIRLDYQFWKVTGSVAAFDADWWKAMRLSVATMREQQRKDGNGPYRFEGRLANAGWGPPIKPTGMICTAFRASDDPAKYLFNIPENLFAVTSLEQLAEMAETLKPGDGFGAECRALAAEVRRGIQEFGIVNHPTHGRMYVYECDGLGNTLLMEDANLPSLVSIPYFTPSLAGNPLVLGARAFAFSDEDPFWCRGTAAEGTCSPHGAGHNKARGWIWPLGINARALTSGDDAEITKCLAMLKSSTAGTGFLHESFNMDDPSQYTRHWFAWVNNLYGELIIKVLRERPQLLAKPIPPGF